MGRWKTKNLDSLRFKRWSTDKVSSRNEIGIIVYKEGKKEDIADIKKIEGHIIAIKICNIAIHL